MYAYIQVSEGAALFSNSDDDYGVTDNDNDAAASDEEDEWVERCVCVCNRVHIYVCAHSYVCMYVCMYVCVYIYTYIWV